MKFISITPKNVTEYEKIIEKQHLPSLIKLYSPQCGHCQAMQPAWDELKTNSSIHGMNVGVIEVRNDALDSIKHETTKNIMGFPTIRLIVNGKIKKEYEGDRSTNDMVNFIKENLEDKNKNKNKGTQMGGKRRRVRRSTRRSTRRKRTVKRK